MLHFHYRRRALLMLPVLATAIAFAACGDDDDNGSNVQPDPFAAIGESLTQAGEDFLEANSNISASVQVMQPHIAAVLGLGSQQGSAKVEGEISCLPSDVRARIFKFNGASYIADADTILSEDITARFILYQLSIEGIPILTQPIGSVELTCVQEIVLQTEIRIYSGSDGIATMALNPATSHFTGHLESLDGVQNLFIVGDLGIEGELTLNFLFGLDDMQATYEFPLQGSGNRVAHATIIGPYPEPDWGFFTEINVDGSEDVVNGSAYYREEPDLLGKSVACIESGTLDAPVYSVPTSECATLQIMPVTPAQLADMSTSYQSLRTFWLAGSGLVEACLAILAAGGA